MFQVLLKDEWRRVSRRFHLFFPDISRDRGDKVSSKLWWLFRLNPEAWGGGEHLTIRLLRLLSLPSVWGGACVSGVAGGIGGAACVWGMDGVAFGALSGIRGGARRGDGERYRQIVFFFFWGPEAPLFCNIWIFFFFLFFIFFVGGEGLGNFSITVVCYVIGFVLIWKFGVS